MLSRFRKRSRRTAAATHRQRCALPLRIRTAPVAQESGAVHFSHLFSVTLWSLSLPPFVPIGMTKRGWSSSSAFSFSRLGFTACGNPVLSANPASSSAPRPWRPWLPLVGDGRPPHRGKDEPRRRPVPPVQQSLRTRKRLLPHQRRFAP